MTSLDQSSLAAPGETTVDEGIAQPATNGFTLTLVEPLNVAASLEFFRRNGDDLLDRWDGATLLRTLPVGAGEARSVAIACQPIGAPDALALRVFVEDGEQDALVGQAMRAMFPAMTADFSLLRQRDPVVDRLATRYPG
ncbi:MAG TPA: hypothetical protein VKQ36_17570, partial [Ktedonobacterales bacterium]|nr:hypothetical protein [Ktedonobacterales bacterium]